MRTTGTGTDSATLLAVEHAAADLLATVTNGVQAYPELLRVLGTALGWCVGGVWLPLVDGGGLSCVASWSAPGAHTHAFTDASAALVLAPGQGLPGRVWEAQRPMWVRDVRDEASLPRAGAATAAGLAAALCFPVLGPSGVEGVVELFADRPRPPDGPLLATVESVGRRLGETLQRLRADNAARDSGARLHAVLEAALDCVVTIDGRGRIVDFNPSAERTFGHAAADVVGRPMVEVLVPPALRDQHVAGMARLTATGEPRALDQRLEVEGLRADGSTFPVELTITRIHGSDAAVFAGHLRDITDRRQAEAELRASRARVVAAADAGRRRVQRDLHDGAQQRLVGVAVVLGRARRAAGGPVAELLDAALAELRLAGDELRDLARGIHPAVLTDLGLAAAVTDLARRSPVACSVDVPPQRLAPEVEATAYFVVAESVHNAARHARAASVAVTAWVRDGVLVVDVVDDGVGGADDGAGSGLLGLRDRLRAADGELAVDSPVGGGTRVTATVPLPRPVLL